MINEKYKNELSNIKSVSNMREQFKVFFCKNSCM